MRRVLIAALLAIAVLGLGSVALIAWGTRHAPPATSFASGPVVEEEEEERTVTAAGSIEPGEERQSLPEPPSAEAGRATRIERPMREGIPAPTRRARASFRLEMKAGFAALQKRVAPCAAADASFTLDVETVEGGVRIVDAHLEARGSATDASVSCARTALLGETISIPSAQAGRRWQLSFAPGSG
jgi:hypothetical protein